MPSHRFARRVVVVLIAVSAGVAFAEGRPAAVSRGPDGVRLRLEPACAYADAPGPFVLREIRVQGRSSTGRDHDVELDVVRVGRRSVPIRHVEVVGRSDPMLDALVGGSEGLLRAPWRSGRAAEAFIVAHPSAPAEVDLRERVEVLLRVDGHRHRLVGAVTLCLRLLGPTSDPEAGARPWDF